MVRIDSNHFEGPTSGVQNGFGAFARADVGAFRWFESLAAVDGGGWDWFGSDFSAEGAGCAMVLSSSMVLDWRTKLRWASGSEGAVVAAGVKECGVGLVAMRRSVVGWGVLTVRCERLRGAREPGGARKAPRSLKREENLGLKVGCVRDSRAVSKLCAIEPLAHRHVTVRDHAGSARRISALKRERPH